MAKNERPGKGRVGEIKNREQVYNPQNKRYVEIITQNHQFINVKSDKKPFKDVRQYKPKGK
jgi:hypothetical protein